MFSEQDAASSLGNWERLIKGLAWEPDLKLLENRSEWRGGRGRGARPLKDMASCRGSIVASFFRR